MFYSKNYSDECHIVGARIIRLVYDYKRGDITRKEFTTMMNNVSRWFNYVGDYNWLGFLMIIMELFEEKEPAAALEVQSKIDHFLADRDNELI